MSLSQKIPSERNLVFRTNCGQDDQFSSPKQCKWSASLGKLLVANINAVNAHIRNADLSFFSKFQKYTSLPVAIDSDVTNIYVGFSSSVRGFNLGTLVEIVNYAAINGVRMIDASGDPDYVYVTSNNATDGHGVRKIRKSDMTIVASLLATGSGDGQFNNPLGIKKYGDYVYVVDNAAGASSRITKLNASDLSFVSNTSLGWAWDIDTDGSYWYVAMGANVYKLNFADFSNLSPTKYIASNAYSLCIIPDQNDGYGQTLCVVSNTNSNIKRHKCSDLSLINSVGSSGDGSSSLFDPTFTTSANTTITYKMDDGFQYTTPSGTSHALSWNGFAGYTFRTPGPHKCTVSCQGGLGMITAIDCHLDTISKVKNFDKMASLATCVIDTNTVYLQLSLIPRSVTYIKSYDCQPGFSGVISQCPTRLTYWNNANCSSITGSIGDLPVTLETGYFQACTGITPASISHLTAIRDIRIYSMGWSSANADTVLLSISDAIHADVNHFTYVTPSLQIGGTNGAPSGSYVDPLVTPGSGNSDSNWLWDAGAGKHKALTGLAAIWVMCHNTGHVWTVTCTGSGPYP